MIQITSVARSAQASRYVVVLARSANLVFFLLTFAYCLLTYSPFAYQQFIRPHLVLALTDFVVWHTTLYWLVLSITAFTLWPHLEAPEIPACHSSAVVPPARVARWLAVSYVAGSALLGMWLIWVPMLPEAENSGRGLVLALAALVPPIWLAAIDHVGASLDVTLTSSSENRLLKSSLIAALFVWATYAAAAPFRLAQAGDIAMSTGALALGMSSSVVAHLTAFTTGFLVLAALGGIASLTRAPGRTEYWLLFGASTIGLTITTYKLIFAPIAFAGREAWLTAAFVAVALTGVWSGTSHVQLTDTATRTWSATDAWLAPMTMAIRRTGRLSRHGVAAISLLALAGVALALTGRAAVFDWNFMAQKLIALGVWLVVFAFVHAATREVPEGRPGVQTRQPKRTGFTAVPVTVLVVFCLDSAAVPRLPALLSDVRLHPDFLLDGYAATDPSYKVIRDALSGDAREGADFYAFLRANTTVRADVKPVDVDFVRPLAPTRAPRPHIFLFVIDSLRPDYLSPYNSNVGFTPAFADFGRDSFVFERAFTRYGGTGLSVPSIWAGGLVFHKEYVRPFRTINALEKLLDVNGYRRLITSDHITDDLFTPSSDQISLDRGVPEMRHTFCQTMDELERDLRSIDLATRPVFAHTRPLDLHVANVRGASVPPGESYPGFGGAYAARVHRIDACFGGFVDFLKESHLYDSSVIVVMSDHGDSLGDELRWGHAYTLFPEVLKIPLMIHLPSSLRERLAADLARVSFTVDVTPTLYKLLGYEPARLGPLFGSPLFENPGQDLSWRRRESYVIASSYGAVYGVLSHNGRKLYIADAINARDYAYDLAGHALGVRSGMTDADRDLNRQLIREQVGALAASYHFVP